MRESSNQSSSSLPCRLIHKKDCVVNFEQHKLFRSKFLTLKHICSIYIQVKNTRVILVRLTSVLKPSHRERRNEPIQHHAMSSSSSPASFNSSQVCRAEDLDFAPWTIQRNEYDSILNKKMKGIEKKIKYFKG